MSFDTELNFGMHKTNLDSTTDAVTIMAGGAVASVVDFGASLWNSLPFTPEVETSDILSRVSNDALQVYQEHPDAIHAASFIGGMFVPMGLAVKGMNAMRAGVKGANWFTNAGREVELAKVTEMFNGALDGTAEYRALTRGIYAKSAINQAIDAVAMEAALVMTMKAHPFMEDYMKDIGSNFALSALIGGGIGSGISIVADRFIIKGLESAVATKSFGEGLDAVRSANLSMTTAMQLQSHNVSINNLQEVMNGLKVAGKDATNDSTYGVAEFAQLNLKAESVTLFESMISPEIKALPKEEKDAFMRMIIDKPEMVGGENFRFLTPKEYADRVLIGASKAPLEQIPTLKNVVKKIDKDTGIETEIITNKEAVFFSDVGLYGTVDDVVNYAGASVLGKTEAQLAGELSKNYGKVPKIESLIELLGKSSANAEGEYIGVRAKVKDMSQKELGKLTIADDDGPLLNAVINRLKNDPLLENMTIKIADRNKVNDAIFKETTETLVSGGKLAPGPNAGYKVEMEAIGVNAHKHKYDPTEHPMGIANAPNPGALSDKAHTILTDWVGGQQTALRKAYVDWQTQQHSGFKGGMNEKSANAFEEIINSPGSKQLREDFRAIADPEGYVYLYRGLKTNKLQGAQPLDSYTTHPSKAQQFGDAAHPTAVQTGAGVKLFKIHVDDIVASFQDLPSSTSALHAGELNPEIIVRSQSRPIEAELSAAGKLNYLRAAEGESTTTVITREIPVGGNPTIAAQLDMLETMLVKQKEDAISALIANGVPAAAIAKKTNTPVDVVTAYAMIKQTHGLDTLVPPGQKPSYALNSIKSDDDIVNALKPSSQPIVIQGNVNKNQFAMNHIALNNREISVLNKEFIAQSMYASPSQTVKEIADILYHPEGMGVSFDIMRSTIGRVNNPAGGQGLVNDFGFLTRNMGEIGPTVAYFTSKIEQVSNSMIKRVVGSMEGSMGALKKDPGAMIEFLTFDSINSSLAEWRMLTSEGKIVQKVEKIGADGKKVTVLEPVKYQGKDYQMNTPLAIKLAQDMLSNSPELKALKDAANRIKGTPNVSDIGMWIPSVNPVNKYIAYVHDLENDTTKLLTAKTETEFKNIVQAYKQHIKDTGAEGVEVVTNTKKEQSLWNVLNGRMDAITMEMADVSMLKTGSSSMAIIKADPARLGEIAAGYEHYINRAIRDLVELNLSDITDSLRRISQYNNRHFADQPLDEVKKMAAAPKDVAKLVLNQLLGQSNLKEYAAWNTVSKTFETGLNIGINAVADSWKGMTEPLTAAFTSKNLTTEQMKKLKDADFLKMNLDLEKRGIAYPWKDFDRATAEKLGFQSIEQSPDTTKRIIYASNALAATALLRFGELAQPLVNAMSLPILTSLAIAQKMPESFMGVQKATAKVSGVQIMYEGIRAINSLDSRIVGLNTRWKNEGLFTANVSEVTNLLRATRSFETGMIASIENGLDSSLVKIMSKPADYAESMTRKVAMNTGAVLARRLYPELDDVGITIFARNFMDKSIGNFHATQRPVLFQGTLGVALGLFQTYSLTLAQSVYRNLELKNYKALGTASLMQSGIFGASSMPGFNQVSEAIGNHYSDDNIDLTTGTYRATGNTAADFILYGLPSNLGPGFSTRGNTNPRFPNLLAGADNVVAINFAKQAVASVGHIASSMENDFPQAGRALGEALSLQSMSRPVARLAELGTGYSITGKGNTIQVPEEVWSFTGVAARLLATRPMEEQKLRDADHLATVYGALDKNNRNALIKQLKTGIRNGTLSDESVAKYSDEYIRKGGTQAGWREAYSNALARTETSGKEIFVQKLKPNSPLNYMIDNL